MTENEAVEALRLINTSRVHPFYIWEEMAEVRDIAISALKEIQQYREIGTVEECREAVEKQKAKRPVLRNDNGKLRKSCPVCGCFFSPLSRSCPKCGQAILWENEDD